MWQMCNLVSFYIPAAAVILAFSDGNVLKEVCDEDPLAICFLAVGAGASAISMLWIPIPRYKEMTERERDHSKAAKAAAEAATEAAAKAATEAAAAAKEEGKEEEEEEKEKEEIKALLRNTMTTVNSVINKEEESNNAKPTKELKTAYLIVCFMGKVAIIFVLAGLLRFGRTIIEKEDDSYDIMSLNCKEEDRFECMSLKCTLNN